MIHTFPLALGIDKMERKANVRRGLGNIQIRIC